jgi:hypothetical protein
MKQINPTLKKGDRVVCVHMDDKYSPVPAGTAGTVKRIVGDPFEESENLIEVEWDNGSTLSLVSSEDMWVLESDIENEKTSKKPIQEGVKKLTNCSQFTTGRQFCEKLTKKLQSKPLSDLARKFFNQLQKNIDLTATGKKIKLEPGTAHFDERYSELLRFYELLKNSGQCTKMLNSIEQDLESVKQKGLVMVVDNDEKYSLFNRLNTHYTNQGVILTQALLNDNKNWKSLSDIDTWKDSVLDSNIKDYLEPTIENLKLVDDTIMGLMEDESFSETIKSNFEYSRGRGYQVESDVAKAFREKGYEVFEFGTDFGFVDHFGVDMVVIKNGILHPVQASSTRKNQPKFFQFNEPNCKCWSVFPYGKTFRVETLLEQTKDIIPNPKRSTFLL